MNNNGGPLTPKVIPYINYGQLLQTITLAVTFGGLIWWQSGFQSESRVKLDFLTVAITDLQRSNDLIRTQMLETKVDLADIKARLPPRPK